MTVTELKAHVLALVEQEENLEKLVTIEALLRDDYVAPLSEKEELRRSVARSEEDIKEDRVHSMEEVKKRMTAFWSDRS